MRTALFLSLVLCGCGADVPPPAPINGQGAPPPAPAPDLAPAFPDLAPIVITCEGRACESDAQCPPSLCTFSASRWGHCERRNGGRFCAWDQ